MHISAVFIRRPIATSLLMLGIALFGVIAYRALPVSDLPNVDFPTLNVGAGLPGGDPGTMASAVASPLERQFTTIAGLDEMTSSSSTGSTNVTLQFDLEPRHRQRRRRRADRDRRGDAAAAAGMPAPPSFRKFNPADQPIMFLGLTSDVVPMSRPRRLRRDTDRAAHLDGERRLAGAGAGRAEVRRSACRSIRTSCTPSSIGLNEVNQALQNWNVNMPTGQLFGPTATYNIKASGQLMNAAAFRPIVVAYRHGAPSALTSRQRHRQRRGQQERVVALHEGRRAGARSTCQVMRQPGSNTIEVTDADPRAAADLPDARCRRRCT